jgi:hypothetical protein
MTASIPRRISKIKKLVKIYYRLEKGALIEGHTDLLRVFDVRGSIHQNKHPHKNLRVYISRKSLKHFVESRKGEMIRKHTEEVIINRISFALDNLQETITHFDNYTFEPPEKYIYVKDYSHSGEPHLRIIVECIQEKLEIKSIHFQKISKK